VELSPSFYEGKLSVRITLPGSSMVNFGVARPTSPRDWLGVGGNAFPLSPPKGTPPFVPSREEGGIFVFKTMTSFAT